MLVQKLEHFIIYSLPAINIELLVPVNRLKLLKNTLILKTKKSMYKISTSNLLRNSLSLSFNIKTLGCHGGSTLFSRFSLMTFYKNQGPKQLLPFLRLGWSTTLHLYHIHIGKLQIPLLGQFYLMILSYNPIISQPGFLQKLLGICRP